MCKTVFLLLVESEKKRKYFKINRYPKGFVFFKNYLFPSDMSVLLKTYVAQDHINGALIETQTIIYLLK